MPQKALVIGGTGPTGPHIVNGLIERGYETAILHRGTHDSELIPAHVERIVGDPHFKETLSEALGDRRFDLIVATYGRMRYVAEVVAEHTDRLITIGGSPGYKGSRQPERLFPRGLQVPLPEDAPRVESEDEFRFGYLAAISEDAVMAGHAAGSYVATHLRYPVIYGPRQLIPMEWRVMRRVLDGRKHIVLPDDGLLLLSRGYAVNMAHAVLLAVDRPEAAGGQIYNAADTHQFTQAQWVEAVVAAMDGTLEIVGVPGPFAYPARDLMIGRIDVHHQLFDTHKIRAELGYTDLVAPLEGLAETVRWYRENPPDLDAEYEADLASHYETEDELAALDAAHRRRLAEVGHVAKGYRHPYAHPKKPNETRDHRKR